jgi:hypothetical protein
MSEKNEVEERRAIGESGTGVFTEVFTEVDLRSTLLNIVAVYTIAGISIGVAGFFTIDAFGGGGSDIGSQFITGVFLIISVVFVALVGVPIAVSLAPRVSDGLRESNVQTYATVGVGIFLGQVAMFVTSFVILGSKVSGSGGSSASGSGGGALGEFFVPMLFVALGVAVAGVAVVYLSRNHDL